MMCFKKQRNKVLSRNIKQKCFGRSLFVFVLLATLCFSGVLYVFQINKMATMGYEIKEKEVLLEDLAKNKKQLELEVAQLKSVYNLEKNKESLKMVKPEEIGVIEVEIEKSFAVNK